MGSSQLVQLPDGFKLDQDPDQKFNQAADFTFGQEGGYMVDKGRPTNYGIIQSTLDDFNKENGYQPMDVKDLTHDDARFVLKNKFFDKPGIGKLPQDTATVLFDYGVNSHPRTAIKALQTIVGTNPDGDLGPKTLQATQSFIDKNGEKELLQKIVDQRQQNYKRLLKNPSNEQWKNGWNNRIKSLKDKFNLSANILGQGADALLGTGTANADEAPNASASDLPEGFKIEDGQSSNTSASDLPDGFQIEDSSVQAPVSSPSPAQAARGAMAVRGLPVLGSLAPVSPGDLTAHDHSQLPDGFKLEDQIGNATPNYEGPVQKRQLNKYYDPLTSDEGKTNASSQVLDQSFKQGLYGHKLTDADKVLQDKHPVISAIGQNIGNLIGFSAVGAGVNPLVSGAAKKVIAKEGISLIPAITTAANVGKGAATFGLKTILDKFSKVLQGDPASMQDVGDVLKSTGKGAIFGGADSIANPIARLTAQGVVNAGSTKLDGADDFQTAISGAVGVLFGLVNHTNYATEFKQQAVDHLTDSLGSKLTEVNNITASQGRAQAKSFIYNSAVKSTGINDPELAMKKVLEDPHNSLDYFEALDNHIKAFTGVKKLAQGEQPIQGGAPAGETTLPSVSPKSSIITEAEKHGTVVGIDSNTKLPIIDTSKPVMQPATPATPTATPQLEEAPATPFVDNRKATVEGAPKQRLSDWTDVIDQYNTKEGKFYQIAKLPVSDSIKGRLVDHYQLNAPLPKTEVSNGQAGAGGTLPSAQGQVGQSTRSDQSSGTSSINRPQEVRQGEVPIPSQEGQTTVQNGQSNAVRISEGQGSQGTIKTEVPSGQKENTTIQIPQSGQVTKSAAGEGAVKAAGVNEGSGGTASSVSDGKVDYYSKIKSTLESNDPKEIMNQEANKYGYKLDFIDKKPKDYLGKHFSDKKVIEIYTKGRSDQQIKDTFNHELGHVVDYVRRGIVADPMGDSVIAYDGKLRPAMDSDVYFRNPIEKTEADNIRKVFPKTHALATTKKEIYADAYKIYQSDPKKLNEVAPHIYKEIDSFLNKAKSKLSNESGQANLPGVPEVAAISKELINWFAPRVFVPRASLDTVMTELGNRNKLEFELETSMGKITKFFDKQDPKDNIAFIDRIKLGQPQPTKELQGVANMMRDIEDIMHAEAKQFKPSLSYKDNHYRVLWKVIPGSKTASATTKGGFKGVFRRPLQGSKGFAKQSTLADMSEGIQRGGVPQSYNPSVMWQNGLVDMQKFITANRMFKTLKDMGYVKFIKLGETSPDGFKKLDDRISTVYFPTPPGLVHAGNYYVEENTSRILNNFLSRDLIRESNVGKGLLALKNVTTSLELSLSPFHAAYTALTSSASEIGTGLQRMYNVGLLQGNGKEFLKGLSDVALSVRAPYYLTRVGTNIIQMVREKGFLQTPAGQAFIKEFPQARQMLDDLFTGGGKLAMHQDYKINSLRAFKEGLKNKEPWAVTLSALPAANEMIMKPLFEQFIPRLKIGNFLREYSQELVARADQLASGKLTRPELARQVWDSVENRFGEMNFDNLFWNRTFKSAMQLLFRSVTWKIGALKNITSGTSGQVREIVDAIQGRHAPKLNRNTAYLLGLGTLIVAASEIIQQSNGQGQPKTLKDLMAPRYDDEGNRISLNTHLKDWVHIAHSPAGFVQNSLSGDIGKEFDIWNNKDFYGTKIYNEDDPIWKREFDKMKHRFPTPFSVTSFDRLSSINAPKALKASTLLGFTQPSPKYISNTPAEQLASDIVKQHLPVGGRTQEETDSAQMRFKLMEDYKKNGKLDDINKALESEKITKRQMNDIIKKAGQTPLERMTNHMAYDEVSRLIEVAEPKELDSLINIFTKKIDHKISAAEGSDRRELQKIKSDLLTKYKK